MGTILATPVQATTLFIPELGPRKKESALSCMIARAREAGVIRDVDSVRDALLMRERLGSTGTGKGVAVPHARSLGVLEPRLVFARSSRGILWGSPDEHPVQLILLVLSPGETSLEAHLEFVGRAVGITRLARNRARLMEAGGADAVAALLRQVWA